MTGFGKAEGNIGERKLSFQMRSLNSKSLDLSLRIPSFLKELEGELRREISNHLYRGKIELSIQLQAEGDQNSSKLNKEVFKNYFEELKQLSIELGQELVDPITTISKFPEVFSSQEIELSEEEKKQCLQLLVQCIEDLKAYRAAEGSDLENDLRTLISDIDKGLEKALEFEDERISTVRNRLKQKIQDLDISKLDNDRFEQEMIYYIEKFDISEEKVRLRSHCQYFIETIEKEEQQGKKLNFISQEIGREINTLGSKANHAEMQKSVVMMKESLEKIKEQVLNIL